MINTFIGRRKQIRLENDLVIPVEIVEELPNNQYLCQDVAGRWRSPLPYAEDELHPIDDSPSIPHRPLEPEEKYCQIKVEDRYQVKQSDGWLKGTVRSISDTHFRFEWDETYIGSVLKLDASFALSWIRGIQNGHSPPKLHLAPPKDDVLGDKTPKQKSRAAKPVDPLEREKLMEEKCRLLSQKIAPDNCWVETGQATKTFRQCWYRSKHPIFDGKKTHYLGREDSPAAREARDAIAHRNRLRIIKKKLSLLEKVK